MLRVFFAVLALFAGLAVTAAYAQPQACKKVDVRFGCRSGATGSATFNCHQGETAEQCCARYRRRASDPRRGFCTGRDGGIVRFACGCARGGGGGRAELRPLDEAGPPVGAPAGEVRPLRPALEGIGPREEAGAGGPRRCPRVGYAFACRREGSASGQLACRGRENERACCARAERLARESCRGKGGVARLRCACPGDPGRGREELPRIMEADR